MTKKYIDQYTCKLLSDVVLPRRTATEVNLEVLDYIPGAVFRGIVATAIFKKSKKEIQEILFSGNTQFSDARLRIKEKRSLPIPLDWRYLKDGVKSQGLLNSQLTQDDWGDGKQYKLFKEGYFVGTSDGLVCSKIAFNAHPKSARNRNTGSSAEGKLFIYKSIQAGQVFSFRVSSDSKDYLNAIREELIGEKQIGKSRRAEFGHVDIQWKEESEVVHESASIDQDTLKIFLTARCCFVNQYGHYIGVPDLQEDLFLNKEARIDWEKSTIRTERYAPWNGLRRAMDAERLCLSPGSTIVIENFNSRLSYKFFLGIGRHRSEGFGEILINPSFLQNKSFALDWLENMPSILTVATEPTTINSAYTSWINVLEERKANDYAHLKRIAWDFRDKYFDGFKAIPPHQWSTLRKVGKIKTSEDSPLVGQKTYREQTAAERIAALTVGGGNMNWLERNRLALINAELENLVDENEKSFFLTYLASIMSEKRKSYAN